MREEGKNDRECETETGKRDESKKRVERETKDGREKKLIF